MPRYSLETIILVVLLVWLLLWLIGPWGLGNLVHVLLVVILIVALFVFGPQKLPELGKSLGESIRGFKKAMNEKDPDGDADK